MLIGDIILFFMYQNEFDDNGRWALVGVALILAMAWVYLEEAPKAKKKSNKIQPIKQVKKVTEEETEMELPPAVTEDNLDGASLRERKLAKVRAANELDDEEVVTIEPDDDLEEVQVTVEEVHVASEYVVEASPQSIEDAAIAAHIQEKETDMTESESELKSEEGNKWPKLEHPPQRCGKNTHPEKI